MSETPGSPEYYTPPAQAVPTPAPPPSISEAAQQWTLAQDGRTAEVHYQATAASAAASATAQYAYAAPPPRPSTPQGAAIAALVVGIIGVLTGWLPAWGVAIGIAAIILGVIALAKKQSKGMAVSGLVMGVISIIESVIIIIVIVASANSFNDDYYLDDDYHPSFDADSGEVVTFGTEPIDGIYISDQAFGLEPTGDNVWWYVVYLDNPSDVDYAPIDIEVDALAADGSIIESESNYLDLPSGKSALFGNFWNVGEQTIDSIRVTGPVPSDVIDYLPEGDLTFTDLKVLTDDYSTSVAGTITSHLSAKIYGGVITVVARDAEGTIIGGANLFFQEMEPGQAVSGEAHFFYPLPRDAKFEFVASVY